MEYLKPETIEAIRVDEFARRTIEATRQLIYAHFRDWSRIDPKGRILFCDEDASIGYAALCALLGVDPFDTPDLGPDAKVNIGNGVTMKARALEELTAAFRKGPEHP